VALCNNLNALFYSKIAPFNCLVTRFDNILSKQQKTTGRNLVILGYLKIPKRILIEIGFWRN